MATFANNSFILNDNNLKNNMLNLKSAGGIYNNSVQRENTEKTFMKYSQMWNHYARATGQEDKMINYKELVTSGQFWKEMDAGLQSGNITNLKAYVSGGSISGQTWTHLTEVNDIEGGIFLKSGVNYYDGDLTSKEKNMMGGIVKNLASVDGYAQRFELATTETPTYGNQTLSVGTNQIRLFQYFLGINLANLETLQGYLYNSAEFISVMMAYAENKRLINAEAIGINGMAVDQNAYAITSAGDTTGLNIPIKLVELITEVDKKSYGTGAMKKNLYMNTTAFGKFSTLFSQQNGQFIGSTGELSFSPVFRPDPSNLTQIGMVGHFHKREVWVIPENGANNWQCGISNTYAVDGNNRITTTTPVANLTAANVTGTNTAIFYANPKTIHIQKGKPDLNDIQIFNSDGGKNYDLFTKGLSVIGAKQIVGAANQVSQQVGYYAFDALN